MYSYPEVRDVREGNTVFSGVAAYMFDIFGVEVNGAPGQPGETRSVGNFSRSWT